MIHNSPSFHRLYGRSRFSHSIPDDDSSPAAKVDRQERERFAVTALGFCLRYDPEFLEQFWQTICRVPLDPTDMPRIKPEDILLEPPHWADLQLVSEHKNKRYKWVVEVKAGASLASKQRPDNRKAFEKPSVGYGALFAKAEENRGTKKRYIILGANDDDNLLIHPGEVRLDISVQQRDWKHLEPGLVRTGIVQDLCETLGELKINPFYMEKAKRISVTNELSSIGKVWTVLDNTCQELKITSSSCHYEGEAYEDSDGGGGSMGVYIKTTKKKNLPPKQRELQRVTRKDGWCLLWFGYEYDEPGAVKKSVEFYFSTQEKQEALHKLFPKGKPWQDGAEYSLKVTSPLKKCNNDFDWFKSIFDHALRN